MSSQIKYQYTTTVLFTSDYDSPLPESSREIDGDKELFRPVRQGRGGGCSGGVAARYHQYSNICRRLVDQTWFETFESIKIAMRIVCRISLVLFPLNFTEVS